jgi:hypothetical protein
MFAAQVDNLLQTGARQTALHVDMVEGAAGAQRFAHRVNARYGIHDADYRSQAPRSANVKTIRWIMVDPAVAFPYDGV